MGVGSGEWGKRGNGGVCSIHRGWRSPPVGRSKRSYQLLIDEDISFLENFSKEYSTYFQEQIKADLGYFNHGSGLLDKAIASIRGRVAIDRANSDRLSESAKQTSDRNLQITILAVGTSIGVGGIVASSYTLVTKEEPLLPPFSTSIPHRFTISIFYSLALGLLAGLLIWGVDRSLQNLNIFIPSGYNPGIG